jgi:hypothetical protein
VRGHRCRLEARAGARLSHPALDSRADLRRARATASRTSAQKQAVRGGAGESTGTDQTHEPNDHP